VLPVRRTRLRAIVTLGAETVTSRPVALTVRRARRWTTSARDDGRYVMRPGGQRTKRLRVTGGGRELRGFEAEVPLLCPSALPGLPFTNETGYAAVGPIRIAPDGSFLGVATAKNTSIRVPRWAHESHSSRAGPQRISRRRECRVASSRPQVVARTRGGRLRKATPREARIHSRARTKQTMLIVRLIRLDGTPGRRVATIVPSGCPPLRRSQERS
jgi:hypothetical protein